jgi:ankyrin repeat protein
LSARHANRAGITTAPSPACGTSRLSRDCIFCALGPDIGKGFPALHLAAQSGQADAVETLLELGADLAIRDTIHEGTPAGWAQHGGYPELADRLS